MILNNNYVEKVLLGIILKAKLLGVILKAK